jgi:hypothetical protein
MNAADVAPGPIESVGPNGPARQRARIAAVRPQARLTSPETKG